MFTLILIIIILAIALATCCSMYNSERKENIKKGNIEDVLCKRNKEISTLENNLTEEKKKNEIAMIKYRDALRRIDELQKDGNTQGPPASPEKIAMREYFNMCGCKKWNRIDHTSDEQSKIIARAIPPISIKSYDPVTKKAEVNGLKNVYRTTLTSCTCDSFKYQQNKTPCKHIYFLLQYIIDNKRKQEDEISKYVSSLTLDETDELYKQLIKK